MSYKHFTIIMSGYNCSQWLRNSLDSVCNQNYPKDMFEIYYYDAASTDECNHILESYEYKVKNFHYQINKPRKYQVENILTGVKESKEGTICVTVDGDDWLPHLDILTELNSFYNDDIWMSYGVYTEYPRMRPRLDNYLPYPLDIIQNNYFRAYRWQGTHLRTWRKELFMKIKDEDLRDADGGYYKAAGDLAFMFPMLEMAAEHSLHTHRVMYVYNISNPINENKVMQDEIKRIEKRIREIKPYQQLEAL